jgi:CDP-diacylglycerol--serine O-phosphatidyltransferase
MVLPVIIMAVLFIALLVSYPWQVLGVGTLLYLACLPLGWFSYRGHERADAAALKRAGGPAEAASAAKPPPVAPAGEPDEERPVRLN